MYSCDNLLVSQIIKWKTYGNLSLMNGISNNFRVFRYSDKEIAFPDGRGYIDYTISLDLQGIAYELLSIDDLELIKQFEDIIVLIPKDYLETFGKKINFKVTQVAVVYSAFKIDSLKNGDITLSFANNSVYSYQKMISIAYLKELARVNIKPLDFVFKIILLKKEKDEFTSKQIKSLIRKNVGRCLTNSWCELEGTECFSGIQFYRLLEDQIINIINSDISKTSNRVCMHIFASALNAGGSALFRRDFTEALFESKYLDNICNVEVNKYLTNAISAWDELCRIMRFFQKGEAKYAEEKKITQIINEIKSNEIEAFSIIKKKITG